MKPTASPHPGLSPSVLVLLRFRIHGNARFLSHAETLRIFQRACVRTRIDMVYSGGFNPRPKLSLPLPRNVGLEVEDDVFTLIVHGDASLDVEHLKGQLARQLPEGFELTRAELATRPQLLIRGVATYTLSIKEQLANKELTDRIKALMDSTQLMVQRYGDSANKPKRVDIRGFLKSVDLVGNKVFVDCAFGPDGTARVDEMMELLGLTIGDLDSPVRRVQVRWQKV